MLQQYPLTARGTAHADSGPFRFRLVYPLLMTHLVKHTRRAGRTRVSAKNQVTIPVEALRGAGIRIGDVLRAEVRGPGEVALVRDDDPLARLAGALTGVYEPGELDRLRDEWD